MTNSLTRRILGTVLFIGTLLFFLASLSWSAFSQTQPHVPRPYLVADINPGPDASNPDFLTAGSETLYAFASDPDQRGVWATDGSEEGTRFLAEIYPNYPNEYYVPAILYPTPVAEYGAPVAVGDDLFFVNKSDGEFDELWHSDGSPTGTMLINDTLSGTLGYPGYFMGSLTPFNQKELMFRGSDAEHGTELWISDGTLSQTHILTDLVPGLTGSLPYSLIHVDEHIYFRADDATLGDVLWRTDGTPEGTELVVDIPGDCAFLCNVTYVNGLFFFIGNDPTYGYEYWRSDGTQAGTWLLKDIASGSLSSFSYHESNSIGFEGNFYFYADDRSTYRGEIWRSDGTEANTVLLKDINAGTASSSANRFAVVDGRLFFTADDGTHGRELWISDGTEIGTSMVLDINATGGAINYSYYSYPDFASFDGLYFFAANDGVNGLELWQSDGTAAGTVMVMDIIPGPVGSEPRGFAVLGNTLYFTADDGVHGREIWALSHDAIAEDDTVITRMGQPATILFLENDNYLDPDQLQIAIASQPQHGSVALNNFAFLYTPEMGYIGPDSFTYTLSDGVSAPEAATVTITVEGHSVYLPIMFRSPLLE